MSVELSRFELYHLFQMPPNIGKPTIKSSFVLGGGCDNKFSLTKILPIDHQLCNLWASWKLKIHETSEDLNCSNQGTLSFPSHPFLGLSLGFCYYC